METGGVHLSQHLRAIDQTVLHDHVPGLLRTGRGDNADTTGIAAGHQAVLRGF